MTTPRLGAPELTAGQAVPETTVNQQIRTIEAGAGHFIFKSRVVATPPASPADGDCYLIAASPTGVWSGKAGQIAFLINTAWAFITPIQGFTAWVNDEALLIGRGASVWSTLAVASAGTFLQASNNLSDVVSAPTSRTNLGLGTAATAALDTDVTLAANSDTSVASQKAIKSYIANKLVGMFDLRGSTDCSANPNYPTAVQGDSYAVTVAGKIGGASGVSVAIGDVYFATADNAGGTQAAVGTSWDILVHASVAAGGGMLAANNLSDVASKVTAKDNISVKGTTIASASTTDLSTATGDFIDISGTTTITALGTAAAGVERTVRFTGILTLTYNATSLILPTAANIITAAGDTAVLRSLGSGNWLCVDYVRAAGTALVSSGTTFASQSEARGGSVSTKAIAPDVLWTMQQAASQTDGATITWDLSAGVNAKVTIAGNRTLAVTNPKEGATYSLSVGQDGTGTRTMTWPSSFDWGATGAPTLTTTASKRDRITFICTDAATPKFDAFLSGKGFS